jgi:hypothetical protein
VVAAELAMVAIPCQCLHDFPSNNAAISFAQLLHGTRRICTASSHESHAGIQPAGAACQPDMTYRFERMQNFEAAILMLCVKAWLLFPRQVSLARILYTVLFLRFTDIFFVMLCIYL